jgi:hypothetical protein
MKNTRAVLFLAFCRTKLERGWRWLRERLLGEEEEPPAYPPDSF